MRIISGSARGKKLHTLDGLDVRPTLDRVKESVFNMIMFDLTDASVLDLFSGSGALGIEALSRGAASAHFVDKSRDALSVTEKNLKETNLFKNSFIHLSDSIEFLKTTDKKFDIIFIDPPYESKLYEKALTEIEKNKILNPDGKIIIELDKVLTPDFSTGNFKIHREKNYGRVKILIMKE